jgi:hypothetical protein
MKRYMFGLVATVIALGAVAFTKPTANTKPLANSTFYYVAPSSGDYTLASVETESNWKTAPSPIPTCSSTPNKACSIVVDNSSTTGSGTSRALNFSLHAKAGAGGSSNGNVPDPANTPQIISDVNMP